MFRADLALVGFGHVGRRFAQLLADCRQSLRDEHQLDCRIIGVVTRRHGSVFDASGLDERELSQPMDERRLGPDLPVADVISRLAASERAMRVMVETTTLDIRDGQPATAHIERALDAGCHVITANKGPLAFAYRALRDLARQRKVSFLFESAVMDGVPVFNLVRQTLPAVKVIAFRGIVNTTTQHVITALESGSSFSEAVEHMQRMGIAEADPSLDLEGWDAAAKTAALANVLMNAELTPQAVERDAVAQNIEERVRKAPSRGGRLRLVASALRHGDEVHASVRLTELDARELLASLPGTANAILLQTDLVGEIAICQMAGDLTQTAYGLLGDLIAVRRRLAS